MLKNRFKKFHEIYESRKSHKSRKLGLRESDKAGEMSIQEKVEKICNDPELFKKNFFNMLLSEVSIECGTNLKAYADETEWWGEQFVQFILKSLKDNNEYNEPLVNGDLDCYFLFDNEDYDASLYTFDDEDEWIEAVRDMCCDKEIWEYNNVDDIFYDEVDIILE